MLGKGGRWSGRHARGFTACALFTIATCAAACGGRTSALEPYVYDGSIDEVSGSGGKTSAGSGGRSGSAGSGGRHSSSTAGKPASSGGRSMGGSGAGGRGSGGAGGDSGAGARGGTDGRGGMSGTGGASGNDVLATCQRHCSSYGFLCGESATTCPINCQDELDALDVDCRTIGVKALACVDAFFTKGATCAASTTALQACGDALHAFHACKGSRIVTPIPRASPGVDVTACSGLLTGNAVSCKATFSCVDGDYNVYCGFGSGSIADCSCVTAAGATRQTILQDDRDPCHDAAQMLCR